MKAYIASPFFYIIAVQEVELIKRVLAEFGIEVFSPKDDNLVSSESTWEEREHCFKKNIDEINNCDFMIANTRDKDMGTLIEIGVAFDKKKPIILFCPQLKGRTINVMLTQLAAGFAFTEEELRTRIQEFLDNKLSPKFMGKIE